MESVLEAGNPFSNEARWSKGRVLEWPIVPDVHVSHTGYGFRQPSRADNTPERFEVFVKSRTHSIAVEDNMSSGQRQRQLPAARPGTFIRASVPRLSTSCSGAIASAAFEDHASCINVGAASLLQPSGRFR
jgi:hypothetical protein